jgi:hypothetical protein
MYLMAPNVHLTTSVLTLSRGDNLIFYSLKRYFLKVCSMELPAESAVLKQTPSFRLVRINAATEFTSI